MIYDSQSENMKMAFTGESLITRSLSPFTEKRFLDLMHILREADLTFTNAETLFHDYEASPATGQRGTWMRSAPRLIEELKWAGIDVMSTAMNHAYDYGENGVLVNSDNLHRYDMPHAGSGATLSEARAPVYVDTPQGRVALLAACDYTDIPGSKAMDPRTGVHGKPGVNIVGVQPVFTMPEAEIARLRQISEGLGWEADKQALRNSRLPQHVHVDTDTRFHFGHFRNPPLVFEVGDEKSMTIEMDEQDVEENMKWIRDARRMADWVIFSFHSHYEGWDTERPAPHVVQMARAAVDAGADVFIGHGPHRDKGIEIYKGKPIFYSLGNFILQNDTVTYQPTEAFEKYNLPMGATPADFYDARSGRQTRGQDVDTLNWQSTAAVVNWHKGQLAEIKLYPVDLGIGLPMGQRGRPVLATGSVARDVLERMQHMSKAYGTDVELRENYGIITF